MMIILRFYSMAGNCEDGSMMVQIVSYPQEGDRKPEFHLEQGLKMVLKNVANTCPVLIVCVSGKYRTGKSFLVNLLATYLTHTVTEVCCMVSRSKRILHTLA